MPISHPHLLGLLKPSATVRILSGGARLNLVATVDGFSRRRQSVAVWQSSLQVAR